MVLKALCGTLSEMRAPKKEKKPSASRLKRWRTKQTLVSVLLAEIGLHPSSEARPKALRLGIFELQIGVEACRCLVFQLHSCKRFVLPFKGSFSRVPPPTRRTLGPLGIPRTYP